MKCYLYWCQAKNRVDEEIIRMRPNNGLKLLFVTIAAADILLVLRVLYFISTARGTALRSNCNVSVLSRRKSNCVVSSVEQVF